MTLTAEQIAAMNQVTGMAKPTAPAQPQLQSRIDELKHIAAASPNSLSFSKIGEPFVNYAKNVGTNIAENVKTGAEALTKAGTGEMNPLAAGAKIAASATSPLWAPVVEAIKPVFHATTEAISKAPGVEEFAMAHDENKLPGVQQVKDIAAAHPVATEAAGDIATTGLNLLGIPGAKTAAQLAEQALIGRKGTIGGPPGGGGGGGILGATDRAVGATADAVRAVAPHPIEKMLSAADTYQRNNIKEEVKNLVNITKGVGKKTREAEAAHVDIEHHLSDPKVYKGLRVENGKINPDASIATIDERIDALMNAKQTMLPKIDMLSPTIPRETVLQKSLDYAKDKLLSNDQQALENTIRHQLSAYPENLTPSEVDAIRARARGSSRDAKGQMKSTSEYAAIENGARDSVFEATDDLAIEGASQFKAINDYIKQMIKTKEFLDKTLRNQVVKGGKVKGYSLKLLGAVAGVSHGPIAAILGHQMGGVIADIIVNNQLGSSIKMYLIHNITNDPVILKQAEELMRNVQQTPQLALPARGESSYKPPENPPMMATPEGGAPVDPTGNTPIAGSYKPPAAPGTETPPEPNLYDEHYPQDLPAIKPGAPLERGPVDPRIPLDIGEMIEGALSDTIKGGGSTIDILGERPDRGFSVSIGKTTEHSMPDSQFTRQSLREYGERMYDLLKDVKSGNKLGTWKHEGRVYMDVIRVYNNEADALAQAAKIGEKGYYDLGNGKTIFTDEAKARLGVNGRTDEGGVHTGTTETGRTSGILPKRGAEEIKMPKDNPPST